MKTLCLDSAHKYLVIGLYENDRMICGTANLSWKRQSETIFPELMRLMKEAGWDSDDVNEVVITDGPGSYTGERIYGAAFATKEDLKAYQTRFFF